MTENIEKESYYKIQELIDAEWFPFNSWIKIKQLIDDYQLIAIRPSPRKILILKSSVDKFMKHLINTMSGYAK